MSTNVPHKPSYNCRATQDGLLQSGFGVNTLCPLCEEDGVECKVGRHDNGETVEDVDDFSVLFHGILRFARSTFGTLPQLSAESTKNPLCSEELKHGQAQSDDKKRK